MWRCLAKGMQIETYNALCVKKGTHPGKVLRSDWTISQVDYKNKPGQKNGPSRWMGNKTGVTRQANNVQENTVEQSIVMTSQQLDQILKLIPRRSFRSPKETETDEEIDYGFSGMVYSNKGNVLKSMESIIYSGQGVLKA